MLTVFDVDVGPDALAFADEPALLAGEGYLDEVRDLDRVRVLDSGVDEGPGGPAVDGGRGDYVCLDVA